jgi:hypothetical protein
MSQYLKITSILAVSLSLSGCLTWPDDAQPSGNGPFSSAPASTRSSTPSEQPEQSSSGETPTSSSEGATGPLNSPVVVYRPQPRFKPVVVDNPPSPEDGLPSTSDVKTEVSLQRGSGGKGNAAVKSLVIKADAAYDRGDSEGAIAQLERAVRIEPRNGYVWYKIASLRMALQEPAEAESLAQKSLGFAGDDKKLQADNWELISVTRRMRGDTPGANFAARQSTLALQQR